MTTVTQPQSESGHRAHLGWALALITVAQLMVVLDATIANIALPYIQEDLGFTNAGLTWVVTGYALAFGSLLLLGGRLGDLYGRRRIFMIGLIVFAIASLLGGLAQSESLLLAARALQGLGAAMASPAALALITTTFPAGPARNRAFAVYAAMSGAGAAVGLILGGWLTGSGFDLGGVFIHGWRLTFLINVPIGLIAAFMAPRVLSESERHPGSLDIPGALTGSLGLLGVVYGLSRAGNAEYGWGDARTLTSLAAGVVLLAVFVIVESRQANPLLPFRIFTNRTRAASFVAMFLMPAGMFSMFFYLSLYVQNVMGYSPLKTGFSFLPFSVGIVIAAMFASKMVSKVDPRFLAGTGTLMASLALVGFSRIPYDTSFPASDVTASYATDILPFIVLMSLGMGMTFVPLTLSAVHHVETRDSGIGSGVLNTMQQVGGALGLATLSTIAQHVWTSTGKDFSAAADKAMGAAQAAGQPAPSAEQMQRLQEIAQQQIYTHGATVGFLAGAAMILGASLIVWIFLTVKHQELATDAAEHPEAGVHI
ncbi:MAG: MFS transporter [Nocardioides sp.]|jgi:EmrB/QacA subfamily drug resistance transporter